MQIKLSGRKKLLVFFSEGGFLKVVLSDRSGKINFRRRLKNFLKSEGKSASLRNSKVVRDHYLVFTKESLTFLDVLRLACWLEGRKGDASKNSKN